MTNPYDKTARYAAKMEPVGFLRWLLGDTEGFPFSFREWLDARTIPFPGEKDRTCDTVARLDRSEAAEPIACVVEFQSRRRSEILERLAEYAVRLRRELRHGPRHRGRFMVLGAVVNLTGRPQGNSLEMSAAEVPGAHLDFQVIVRTMNTENAATTLERIRIGAVSNCLLSWIPLMAGGGSEGIIETWKSLASLETNEQSRADYAALALVFAELAGSYPLWKKGLEGWNMIQSKQILEWMAQGELQGELKGELKTARHALLRVLDLRFPGVSNRRIMKQVEASENLDQLKKWFDAAVTSDSWTSFSKAINGAH